MNDTKATPEDIEEKSKAKNRQPISRCSSAKPRSTNVKLKRSLSRNSIDLGHINIHISPTKINEKKSILKKHHRCNFDPTTEAESLQGSKMYPSSILGKGSNIIIGTLLVMII